MLADRISVARKNLRSRFTWVSARPLGLWWGGRAWPPMGRTDPGAVLPLRRRGLFGRSVL
jgi:hypothetical protein